MDGDTYGLEQRQLMGLTPALYGKNLVLILVQTLILEFYDKDLFMERMK